MQAIQDMADVRAAASSQTHTSGLRSLREQVMRIRQGIGIRGDTGMGKYLLTGPGALDAVNRLVVGDISRVPIRKMTYTLILREDGTLLTDAYVVNQGESYLVLTLHGDPESLSGLIRDTCGGEGVGVEEVTQGSAFINLDGAYAWELLKDLTGMAVLGVRDLEVVPDQRIAGIPVILYRVGKTGEFGYWAQVPSERLQEVAAELGTAGAAYDLTPYGQEALDVCRLENRLLNARLEGALARNPLELNCRLMVGQDKGDYLGREAVERVLETGPERRLIGLTLESEGPAEDAPRPVIGDEVEHRGQVIGRLANVQYAYSLERPIAVALVDSAYAYVGLEHEVSSGGTRFRARSVSAPFLTNRSLSIRFQEHSYLHRDNA
ncbi:MAG TPA: glycine cleavage T C-terminal barrel domain-containing protein [Myxococcaceae bacterium]|nr:glycine cleavage T C-terminal barrel domain-containing protein [Myxococcaceae bacterium]